MLSVRLSRMNEFVDLFIIVATNLTYSGLPLKVSYSPFESYIEKYRSKILFFNFSFPNGCIRPWCRENYQRTVISDAIKSFKVPDDSLVIISDLDEIPTSDAMNYITKNPPNILYMLSGYMYYYNYRNRLKEKWAGVLVIKASKCTKDIQNYRDRRTEMSEKYSIPIFPSLTHCSFCYKNISFMQKKIHSFAHSEFNKPPYTERNYIINCIKNHLSIFKRDEIDFVDYDANLLPLPDDVRFNYLKEVSDIV